MGKGRQLTPSEVKRLVKGLKATLAFIRENIAPDVIATRQTHGWQKANAALSLKPNTSKNLSEIGLALLWAWDFLRKNYEGEGPPELADAIMLLGEIGLLQVEEYPYHPTRQ